MKSNINLLLKNNIIRWVVFIPIALLSAIISSTIIIYLDKITLVKTIEIGSFTFKLIDYMTQGLVFGFVFVYVGGIILPHKSNKIIIFTIYILYLILGFISSIKYHDYWLLYFDIFSFIGAFFGSKALEKRKKDKK